ncbi:DUF3572 domain-containing protein [Vannielia sp.]|uniref:DUF3572 domain-containing protein n=1 Tax=Vannielia sp. TaxID=2813045 RepID=UPI00262E6006|nr:DUF3572 domain-containing protein [Vannielia sp.]MDF1872899.1 DUF3572 domain-containing protein [Vannielia sp.]
MKRDVAETIALKALGWLAGNDDLLPVFLGSTGVSEADLRARASEPEFLASVLDFLTMDDQWVTEFCQSEGLDYTTPMQARTYLPGGDLPNWT